MLWSLHSIGHLMKIFNYILQFWFDMMQQHFFITFIYWSHTPPPPTPNWYTPSCPQTDTLVTSSICSLNTTCDWPVSLHLINIIYLAGFLWICNLLIFFLHLHSIMACCPLKTPCNLPLYYIYIKPPVFLWIPPIIDYFITFKTTCTYCPLNTTCNLPW